MLIFYFSKTDLGKSKNPKNKMQFIKKKDISFF